MSKRKYSMRKADGEHLTDGGRERLGTAWNGYVRNGYRISLRQFAENQRVPCETWRREYHRGAAGATIRRGSRWIYAEYDVEKARESIREGKANMTLSGTNKLWYTIRRKVEVNVNTKKKHLGLHGCLRERLRGQAWPQVC